jgi:hypothetical protein
MATLTLNGSAATLTSALKLATLKRVAKLRPEALVVRNDKDQEIFKIEVAKNGSQSKYGVSFDKKDRNGYAIVTTMSDKNFEEMSPEEAAEMFMEILIPLTKLETEIATVVIPGLSADVAAVADAIHFVTEVEAETEAE